MPTLPYTKVLTYISLPKIAMAEYEKVTIAVILHSFPPFLAVIMVGSGGVGKSALTLQFMYDEVSKRQHSFSEWFCFEKVTRRFTHP